MALMDVDLSAQASDDDILAALFDDTRTAADKEKEEEAEEEVEEEEVEEEEEKEATKKKASVRPQTRKKSAGIKQLGNIEKTASDEISQLSQIWPSDPDISEHFE